MRNGNWKVRFALYTVLFLCIAWGTLVGYSRFVIQDARNPNRVSWVPKAQVLQLMEYHGTDVLKITQDEVYIFRGSKWIPVFKRAQG
jgi:hypothetical protein